MVIGRGWEMPAVIGRAGDARSMRPWRDDVTLVSAERLSARWQWQSVSSLVSARTPPPGTQQYERFEHGYAEEADAE